MWIYLAAILLSVSSDTDIPLTIVNDNKEPLVAVIGTNFTYECRLLKAHMQDQLVYYHWFKVKEFNYSNNQYLTDDKWQNSPASSPVLELTDVSPDDEGQYICSVQDNDDLDYKVFNVSVRHRAPPVYGEKALPRFTRQPRLASLCSKFGLLCSTGSSSAAAPDKKENILPLVIGVPVGCLLVMIVVVFAVWRRHKKPTEPLKKHIIFLNPVSDI